MGLKHELTKLRMMSTHFIGRKKGGLNANISQYLAIKYTTEAYIREQVRFGILHSLNSTAVNGDVFIKNLQGGTFAFEHLYLQILYCLAFSVNFSNCQFGFHVLKYYVAITVHLSIQLT